MRRVACSHFHCPSSNTFNTYTVRLVSDPSGTFGGQHLIEWIQVDIRYNPLVRYGLCSQPKQVWKICESMWLRIYFTSIAFLLGGCVVPHAS